MPRYDYACHECDHRFEAVHPITSEALSVCPECGGTLRRVIGAVGVSFKGSGFYRTDSREAARKGRATSTAGGSSTPPSTPTPSTTAAPGSSSSGSSSSGSPSAPAATPDSKPAATSAAKASSAPSGRDS